MSWSQQGSMVGCHTYEATVYAGRGQKDRKVPLANEPFGCRGCRLWLIASGSTRDKLTLIRKRVVTVLS